MEILATNVPRLGKHAAGPARADAPGPARTEFEGSRPYLTAWPSAAHAP